MFDEEAILHGGGILTIPEGDESASSLGIYSMVQGICG